MKYLVIGYRTVEIEVEANSAQEAERAAQNIVGPPRYWDYFEAEEVEEEHDEL